jgi:hypothetical protein
MTTAVRTAANTMQVVPMAMFFAWDELGMGPKERKKYEQNSYYLSSYIKKKKSYITTASVV